MLPVPTSPDLCDRLNSLLDKATEQAPLVADDVLKWVVYDSWLTIFFSGLMLLGMLLVIRLAFILTRNVHDEFNKWGPRIIALVLCVIGMIVTTHDGIYTSAVRLVKVRSVPRLVVLDYLKSAIK